MSSVLLEPQKIIIREGLDRIREEYGDISELAKSIEALGQIEPIVITREFELIAGGRRLAACLSINKPVECIFRDQIDNLTLREIELEENIQRKDLTFVEKAKLVKEIDTLKKLKYGVKGDGRASRGKEGWTQQDTAKLLGKSVGSISDSIAMADAIELFPQIGKAKNEADAKKMLKKIEEELILQEMAKRQKNKPHAGWEYANESYKVGDALAGVEALPDNSFDFAEVDSPYGIDLTGNKKSKETLTELKTSRDYTEWSKDDYRRDILIMAELVYKKLKPNAWCVWWYGQEHYTFVVNMLQAAGFKVDIIPCVWFKGAGMAQTNQPELYLARCYEVFIIARKGNPVLRKRGRVNLFDYQSVHSSARIHPTEKPIQLLTELIDTFATAGDNMLVPFLGSGNTLRAGYMRGLSGTGFDLDENLRTKFLARVADDLICNLYK